VASAVAGSIVEVNVLVESVSGAVLELVSEGGSGVVDTPRNVDTVSSRVKKSGRSSETSDGSGSGGVGSLIRPKSNGASSGADSETNGSSTGSGVSEAVAVASSVSGSIEVNSSVAGVAGSVFKLISDGTSTSSVSGTPSDVDTVSS
jgi:hypothetical protein